MAITKCFIASAGLGTRMGDVGKILPKPLWPIFDRRIMDLQLAYARELGITDIYMNAHHLSSELLNWAKGKNISVLEERVLLGSGGCVHNLKYTHGINEKILIINADQFLFFDASMLSEIESKMNSTESLAYLLGINVAKDSSYNETVIRDNFLTNIVPATGDKSYMTYSGVGILDLEKISYVPGKTGFFETVCNFRENNILMSEPSDYEYWDFGTTKRYIKSLFSCFHKNKMSDFLIKNNVNISGNKDKISMLDNEFIVTCDPEDKVYYKEAVSLA